MLMSLINRDLLPPCMSFYEHNAIFNPMTHSFPKKILIELRRQKWMKDKILTFNQYKIEFENQFTPLESNMDDVFKEMWRIEHLADILDDGNFGSDDDVNEGENPCQREIRSGTPEGVVKEAQETTSKEVKKIPKKQRKVYSKRKAPLGTQSTPLVKKSKKVSMILGMHSFSSPPLFSNISSSDPIIPISTLIITTIPIQVHTLTIEGTYSTPLSQQAPTLSQLASLVIPTFMNIITPSSPPPIPISTIISPIVSSGIGPSHSSSITLAQQIVASSSQELSISSPFIAISSQQVFVDGIMLQYKVMKSNQEGWMQKQLQKILVPYNPIKL